MKRASDLSAIAKLIAIFGALNAGETRISRIAAKTQIPISTVHRILDEAVTAGWARRTDEHTYYASHAAPIPTDVPIRLVEAAGEALVRWYARMGYPPRQIDGMRLYGAARVALTAAAEAQR